jgi:cytochrome c oxidase assembly factor CtaG
MSRPGGISALTDQQVAAGVMWVLGSLAYTITFLIGFYRWLAPDRSAGRASAAFTT